MTVTGSSLVDRRDASRRVSLLRSLINIWFTMLVAECNLNLLHVKEESTPLNPPWDVKEIIVCKDMSKLIKREVPAMILKNMYLCHQREHEMGSYKILTYGSKTENGVAFAVYSEQLSISRRINNCASIFRAELTNSYPRIPKTLTKYKKTLFRYYQTQRAQFKPSENYILKI